MNLRVRDFCMSRRVACDHISPFRRLITIIFQTLNIILTSEVYICYRIAGALALNGPGEVGGQ
jgi:hypothetical protein